jgi:hypothetical protein
MMEAARTYETLVNFYQTTRRYNPEDSHLRTHCRENLKSYICAVPYQCKSEYCVPLVTDLSIILLMTQFPLPTFLPSLAKSKTIKGLKNFTT